MALPAASRSGLLTEAQLKNLDKHQYSCAGRSVAEWPLQMFWNWLVQFVPIWIAPNTLTMIGLGLNTLSSLVLFAYSPHAVEEAPSWVYLTCSFSFFVYQALDAIDGKHARRTDSSTPLGELFDHGCDAVSLAFVGLAVPCSMQMGKFPFHLFSYYMGVLVVFYCAHWRTYISGRLEFGKLDVTEAQLGMMAIHLLSGLLGPQIWETTVFNLLDIRSIILIVSMVTVTVSVVQSIHIVLQGGQGKNGSTVADTSVLSPAFPMLILLFLTHHLYRSSPAEILQNSPLLAGILIGLVCAKLTINLVIAHMSKSGMVLLDSILLAPLSLSANIYIGALLPEFYLALLATFYALFNLCTTSMVVCQQICEHMGIHCFSLVKRDKPH